MRAKQKKKRRFNFVRQGGFSNNKYISGQSINEILEQSDLEEPIPHIAGTTDGGQGDVEELLYKLWLMKSPQQRYEESALGMADAFSMAGPSPGRAVLEDMAFGDSYWAGLARNIATGSEMPTARIPKVGSMGGVEGELPWSKDAERVGGRVGGHDNLNAPGVPQTQRPLSWSELPRGLQENLARIAEENDLPLEEVLRQYYEHGGGGR